MSEDVKFSENIEIILKGGIGSGQKGHRGDKRSWKNPKVNVDTGINNLDKHKKELLDQFWESSTGGGTNVDKKDNRKYLNFEKELSVAKNHKEANEITKKHAKMS